jgi:hypothetical protein
VFVATTSRPVSTAAWFAVAGVLALLAAACGQPAAAPAGTETVTPVYNKQTGRLEQLTSDRDGNGKVDTWAFMDGPKLIRIEIDRNGDGKADRFEHYLEDGATLDRVDEADGPTDRITRREVYVGGEVRRVEEDTDLDGRMDKWEHYERGELVRMDLDLKGRGAPDQRLYYQTGNVVRVESDPDGDGVFAPVTPAGKGGE